MDGDRFEKIVEAAHDYAIISLGAEGQVETWNSGAERLFGYPRDEAIGRPARMIFTPEDQSQGEYDRELKTAAIEGRADDDRWHVRKDGSRFWASGVLSSVRDEAGTVRGFVKIVRDKTDERRLSERLRSSEDQFARLFLANPAAMVLEHRQSGRFMVANDAFFALIGYWRSEALGRTGEDLGVWVDPAGRHDALKSIDGQERCDGVALSIRTKRGETRDCLVAMAVTVLNGDECVVSTLIPQPDTRPRPEE